MAHKWAQWLKNTRHSAHLWATSKFAGRSTGLLTPYAAGVCSHYAHLLATPDFFPHYETSRTPRRQGLPSLRAHLWGTSNCFSGIPQKARIM